MKNKSLTLSIVIPAYNEEHYIKACLDAIARQTAKPDEVILVDNNSTDKTVDVAKKYQFVKIVKEVTRGIVFARDNGFNASTTDLIGRIDADTLLSPDWTTNAKEFCLANPQIAAVTGTNYFYDFPLRNLVHALHAFTYYKLQKWIAGTDILWGSNMVIRRDAWDQVEEACDKTNRGDEDVDLSLRLKKAGLKVKRSNLLRAEVSMRRGDLGIKSLARYLSRWHRTYFNNQMYLSGVLIYLLSALTLITAIVALPISLYTKARK